MTIIFRLKNTWAPGGVMIEQFQQRPFQNAPKPKLWYHSGAVASMPLSMVCVPAKWQNDGIQVCQQFQDLRFLLQKETSSDLLFWRGCATFQGGHVHNASVICSSTVRFHHIPFSEQRIQRSKQTSFRYIVDIIMRKENKIMLMGDSFCVQVG